MKEETQVAKSKIQELESKFFAMLNAGISAMQAAGTALVELLNTDPDAATRLMTEKGIPRVTLRSLERIGRGELMPELVYRPMLGRLGISDQRRICSGTVEAVVIREGVTDTIRVDLKNAEPEMIKQIVAGDHIRTVPEQVQFLVKNTKSAQPSDAATDGIPWRVRGGKIDILRPVRGITRADLRTMQLALEA